MKHTAAYLVRVILLNLGIYNSYVSPIFNVDTTKAGVSISPGKNLSAVSKSGGSPRQGMFELELRACEDLLETGCSFL